MSTPIQQPIASRSLTPLLRWAGGKRWLAESVRRVAELVQPTMYLEPFLGGAAVFLASDWPRPVLGDTNGALVHCYEGLAANPQSVRRKLTALPVDALTFTRVSRWKPTSVTGAAARFLYLNRTAYGGIYRENGKGTFNVPFAGDRDLSAVLKGSRLESTGEAFGKSMLILGDFTTVLARAVPGALAYCDPPYSLPGGEKGFRRYSRSPFDWGDQQRLSIALRRLVDRGTTVLLSNSADEAVSSLYPGAQVLPLVRKTALAKGRATEQKEALYVLSMETKTSDAITDTLSQDLL